MNQTLVTRLSEFLNNNPSLKGQPATTEQITDAENQLQVTLHDSYRQFILQFGGAYAGIAVHAFTNGSSVGKETMVELTLQNRKMCHDMGIFREINQCYVIADDGSGNPVAVAPAGHILLFDYDTLERKVLADSFEHFIEENFQAW